MRIIDHYERLFDYERWANRETLASLERAVPAPAQAVRLMAHIVATQSLWLERIEETPQSHPVWPDWDLTETARRLDQIDRRWRDLLAGLDEPELERPVDYVNSKREPWQSRVGDILAHVLLHSPHHRGQIALVLRGEGREPAYADLVHAIRTGATGSLHDSGGGF